jgi:hypothetical protein
MKLSTLGFIVALMALGMGCTSPRSVRSLSAAQSQNLQTFAATLNGLIVYAKESKATEVKLKLAIIKQQVRSKSIDLEEERKKGQNADSKKLVDLQNEIKELESGMKELDEAQKSFILQLQRVEEFYRDVLVRSNSTLDEWHNRPGISLIDSDSVSATLKRVSEIDTAQGLEGEFRDLLSNLKRENGYGGNR